MQVYPGIIIYDQDKKEYIVEDQLGSGGFGTVFRVKRKSTGKARRCKNYSDDLLSSSIVNECNIPNVKTFFRLNGSFEES